MKHTSTREHFIKYQEMVKNNLERCENFWFLLKEHIWRMDSISSLLKLKELYLEDENLNNISLRFFDRHMRTPIKDKNMPCSYSENSSMLKHYLRYNILGCEFEES